MLYGHSNNSSLELSDIITVARRFLHHCTCLNTALTTRVYVIVACLSRSDRMQATPSETTQVTQLFNVTTIIMFWFILQYPEVISQNYCCVKCIFEVVIEQQGMLDIIYILYILYIYIYIYIYYVIYLQSIFDIPEQYLRILFCSSHVLVIESVAIRRDLFVCCFRCSSSGEATTPLLNWTRYVCL